MSVRDRLGINCVEAILFDDATLDRAFGEIADITCDVLSDEEIAAEIVSAVLPVDDEDWRVGNPLWSDVMADLGACSNCLCTDCGCCVGCGGIDADVDRLHEHGSWCAL